MTALTGPDSDEVDRTIGAVEGWNALSLVGPEADALRRWIEETAGGRIARSSRQPTVREAWAIDVARPDGTTAELERLAAENVKRVVRSSADVQSPWEIGAFMELKTVWHPIGL